ncbi:MAG: DUF2269 family protein [Coxiellaceae bacterium]|nr:DUF2269 family protein [Coxiellaceae bacterium]
MLSPLSIALIQTLHVMCGVVLIGVSLASYFYVMNSLRRQDVILALYALRLSYFADVIFIPLILIQVITALVLMVARHIELTTPWTVVAFIAFAVVVLLWATAVLIKFAFIKQLPQKIGAVWFRVSYSVVYGLMGLVFILIVHDAVLHQTYFAPLVKRMLS